MIFTVHARLTHTVTVEAANVKEALGTALTTVSVAPSRPKPADSAATVVVPPVVTVDPLDQWSVSVEGSEPVNASRAVRHYDAVRAKAAPAPVEVLQLALPFEGEA